MSRWAFRDRQEAGRRLAEQLQKLEPLVADCVVLGLPRGGVPVASAVARVLAAPLDVLLVRKLGAPFQPELAIGAVVDGDPPEVVLNEEIIQELHLSQSDIAAEIAKQLSVIAERRRLYGRNGSHVTLEGKSVIVADDGAATGATLRVALKALRRRRPRRLIAAVPVASQSALDLLRAEADDVICLRAPENFGAVGFYYRDFSEVGDDEVRALLVAAAQSP
jgi:putative phosphoribosyl transferase